jgi:hypothetical protein
MWTHRLMSPSRVDNYLQYMTGELYSYGDRPEYTEQLFIERLLGLDTGNKDKMEAGNAVHKMVELWDDSFNELDIKVAFADGYAIKFNTPVNITYPDLRESWISGYIGDYFINGRIDACSACVAHDLKTTGNIDLEKYTNSMQWKMYCLLGKFDKFIYNIFKVDVDDKIITVKDYKEIELTPYPGMKQEVIEVLREYDSLLIRMQNKLIEAAQFHRLDYSKYL